VEVDKPAVDGLETVKMLRFQELGQHRNIIIGMTSREDLEFIARCKEAGCDDVVGQPIDANTVLAIVAQSISQRPEVRLDAEQGAEVVRPISSHPRFRVSLGPAIADDSFPYLTSIGGPQFVGELLSLFASDAERTLAKLSEAVEQDDINSAYTGIISLGESAAVIGATRLVELCKTASLFGKDRITLAERALVASLRSEVARVVDGIRMHMAAAHNLPVSTPDGIKPGKP
jgi:HPt (histidine-containing phosphotransfer) domain-containing protein